MDNLKKPVKTAILATDLFGSQSLIGYNTTFIEQIEIKPPVKKLQKAFFETIKIQPTYAVSFYRSTNPNYSKSLLPKQNKHKGTVSNKAATKIRNAINWMLLFTDKKFIYSKKENQTFSFYLNFITLTLPSEQKHSDNYIKENMLVPFIQFMTKTHNAFMWLWKAEAQADGNIHFHITSHQFIHWKSVRKKWNSICAKHGYCKVFQDGTNDKGNAATQIKAAKNASQVGGYLANYISKKDKVKFKVKAPKGLPKLLSEIKSDTVSNYLYGPYTVLKRPIDGRLWACSNNIANISCFVTDFDNSAEDICSTKEAIIEIQEHAKYEEFYTVIMYENLHTGTIPQILADKVKALKPLNNQQTQFTVESFMN